MKFKIGLIFFLCCGFLLSAWFLYVKQMSKRSTLSFNARLGSQNTLYTFPDSLKKDGLMLYFLTAHCPEGRKYIPKVKDYFTQQQNKLDVFFVLSDTTLSISDAKKFIEEYGITFDWIYDGELRLAKQLAARTSSQMILMNQTKILYSGRIDDQFQIGVDLPEPRSEDLKQALQLFFNQQLNEKIETPVSGCAIY